MCRFVLSSNLSLWFAFNLIAADVSIRSHSAHTQPCSRRQYIIIIIGRRLCAYKTVSSRQHSSHAVPLFKHIDAAANRLGHAHKFSHSFDFLRATLPLSLTLPSSLSHYHTPVAIPLPLRPGFTLPLSLSLSLFLAPLRCFCVCVNSIISNYLCHEKA